MEEDQTYVRVKTETLGSGYGRSVKVATIEVWPGEGKQKPTLDFMPPGCEFEDETGQQWKITRARQVEQKHRYVDEDGGYEKTYSWYYEAIDADFRE